MPCGWSSSQPGLHPLSSFSSCLSSSCGICGGRRSLIHCGMVMVGKQAGCWSPGNQRREPCHPFWGWPWKSLCSCYHLPCCCWACHPSLRRTSWRRARGTLSCGCARLRMIQRPASDTSRIHSWHCNAL